MVVTTGIQNGLKIIGYQQNFLWSPQCHNNRLYRVTHHVGQNLPLTSKQKFRFGLARPGKAKRELVN